jgi:hypothetical protein
MLPKTGEETIFVPSDEYLPCLESPLGLGAETLVEGGDMFELSDPHEKPVQV